LARALGLSPSTKANTVPTNIPNEIVVAKLSIEAAVTALESLFERMNVMPRAEKVLISDTVQEACSRLQAAKDLLARLENVPPDGDAA
jgi:hypothetical protein